MKGLKQLVEQALGQPEAPPPVDISNEARRALSIKMREWSGWPDSTVRFGKPEVSPFAQCDHSNRVFTVNADALVLNPNRVLLTVTPFRLKQEAVLTGCMLHEAGHARHSHWRPRTDEAVATYVHGAGSTHEGEPVNVQTNGLAVLMEEPRVEGLMARDASRVGADGLGWTMRAAGAKLAPFTHLSVRPDQKVMDVITSWALRSGKQMAVAHWTKMPLPNWVNDLTSLMHGVLVEHLYNVGDDNPARTAQKVIDQLILMAVCVDDRGTYMVDSARDILDMLFPETDGDSEDAPQAGQGCTAPPEGDSEQESESEAGDDGEGDEAGEDGEGDTEPEDEGSGEDPGAGDSGDDEDGEPDEADANGKPTEEKPDSSEVSDESDTDDPSQEGDPGGGESEVDDTSDLAKALADLESQSKDETEAEAEDLAQQQGGDTGGDGDGEGDGGGWRTPTKEERQVQHGAEQFLRSMIEPTERSRITFTDTPSSVIDGAAYEAWRAGGKIRAPHFFKQTRRSVEPAPPVRIAVLVDVSMSMDVLAEPAAVLSWSLASAALDLRNFAGRGQQIESCLIHWGGHARVIQEVGKPMSNVLTWDCVEGTSAFPEAMELVEEQMPGFFDVPLVPVNRLVVNFTDWEFNYSSKGASKRMLARQMEAGVNMLSVVPGGWTERRGGGQLAELLSEAKVQRGKRGLVKYNENAPGQVWESAAEMLSGNTPAPFAGF